jgi:hypothetical protein
MVFWFSIKTRINFMLIKTQNKWDACRAFINTWLLDKTVYCNSCNLDYSPATFPCCDTPELGVNADHTINVIKQNRERQKVLKNSLGTNNTKTMRWAVSLPPRLYFDLEAYFKKTSHQKLFVNPKEMRTFARKFKMFAIAERI